MNFKFDDAVWYGVLEGVVTDEKDCDGEFGIDYINEDGNPEFAFVKEGELTPRLREAQRCWVRNFGEEKFKEAQFLNMENKKYRVVPKGGGGMLFDEIRLTNPNQSTLDEIEELKERIKELEKQVEGE